MIKPTLYSTTNIMYAVKALYFFFTPLLCVHLSVCLLFKLFANMAIDLKFIMSNRLSLEARFAN